MARISSDNRTLILVAIVVAAFILFLSLIEKLG